MGQKSSTVIDTQKRYILPSPGVMGAGNRVYGLITIYTPSEIHQLQVTPSLSVKSAKLYIDPKNKNDIKLYIGDRELTNETKLIEIDSNAMIKAVYWRERDESTNVNSQISYPKAFTQKGRLNVKKMWKLDLKQYEVEDPPCLKNKIRGTGSAKGINKMKQFVINK